VIVEGIEIIDKLLVVVHGDVRLSFLNVCDFLLITAKLFLKFFDDSLVILNFYLRILVSYSFSRVRLGFVFLE